MSPFARPCASCGARVPAGGVCPVCGPSGRQRASSCRVCGVRTEAGAPYCSEHSAEQERLQRQPWRQGYSDPAYLRSRETAWKRSGGLCEGCGGPITRESAECDHDVPLRDGGTNVVGNLRWLGTTVCRCHQKKTRRDRRRRKGTGG